MARRLYFSRLFLLVLFGALVADLNAQHYINEVYGEANTYETATNVIVDQYQLVLSGALSTEGNSTQYVFRKLNLEGTSTIEKYYNPNSTLVSTGNATNFITYSDNYYYLGNGSHDESFGLYCLNQDLDTLWVNSFSAIQSQAITHRTGNLLLENDSLILTANFMNGQNNRSCVIAQTSLNTIEFVIKNKISSNDYDISIEDIGIIENRFYYSGLQASTWFGSNLDGCFGSAPIDQGFITNVEIIENPDILDLATLTEKYTDSSVVACYLISDEEIVNDVYARTLWLRVFNTETLVIENEIPVIPLFDGNLYDFISTSEGYVASVCEYNGAGYSRKALLIAFDNSLEVEYTADLEFIHCLDCSHRLLDIDTDEFGNIYGAGYATLDTLGYEGTYAWVISADCHGKTEAPDLSLSIDTLNLSNGEVQFSVNNNNFDQLSWSIDNETNIADSITAMLSNGLHNIELTGTYCGYTYTESIELDIVVAIEEQEPLSSKMLIYPSPTQGLVHIESKYKENSSIEIYSILGELIHSANLNSTHTTFDLGPFASGIYYVKRFQNGKLMEVGEILKGE